MTNWELDIRSNPVSCEAVQTLWSAPRPRVKFLVPTLSALIAILTSDLPPDESLSVPASFINWGYDHPISPSRGPLIAAAFGTYSLRLNLPSDLFPGL